MDWQSTVIDKSTNKINKQITRHLTYIDHTLNHVPWKPRAQIPFHLEDHVRRFEQPRMSAETGQGNQFCTRRIKLSFFFYFYIIQ